MQNARLSSILKQWLRPSRLIPLLTILGAGAAVVLSRLQVTKLSIAEEIVISLLALLAADALSERIGILEGIENRLSNLSTRQLLKSRAEIPSYEEKVAHASEICILAVSAISLIHRFLSNFESRVKDGCELRVVLLDPDAPSLDTWDLLSKSPTTESDIRSALQLFKQVMDVETNKGKCEVRLADVFLPFSIVAFDTGKETGEMHIEYYTYKTALSERPHIYLTSRDSSHWFSFYQQQFEQIWSEATLWTPE
jgi:hypothetical protein